MRSPDGANAGAATVRRHNLGLVLRSLSASGSGSRTELAAATGLSKATVGSLIDDLVARRLVRDQSTVQGPRGRPRVLVTIDPTMIGLGLLIDVDRVGAVAADTAGRIVGEQWMATDNRECTPEEAMQRVAAVTGILRRRLRRAGHVVFCTTVAIPGLVRDGEVLVAPNLGWQHVAAAKLVAARLRQPPERVRVDNEANLAALAELVARDPSDLSFIAVSGGVGIGAGVVLRGSVERGAHGFGGELGHFVVEPEGRTCACGNRGCLETVAGAAALRRDAGVPFGAEWLEEIRRRADAHDAATLHALEHAADALGRALAAATSMLDVEMVVLGGFLATLTPWVAERVEAVLSRLVLGARFSPIRVEASSAGSNAAAIGAALASVRVILDDPSAVAVA